MTALYHTIKHHWFKIALIALILLFFVKKEVTFQLNLKNKEFPTKSASSRYTEQKKFVGKEEKFLIFDILDILPTGKNLKETFDAVPHTDKVAFVKRFGKVARDEQDKFGIPASVIIASAMIQSSVGNRTLCQDANNYFALPCGTHWQGSTTEENGDCYRAYNSAWESFRDHSLFLIQQFKTPKNNNYKKWIPLIADTFQTKEEYTDLLIEVIEKYDLHLLDK